MSAPNSALGGPPEDDLLAPYRLPGAAEAAMMEPPLWAQSRVKVYRAFGVASGQAKPLRLDIRAARGLAIARTYSSITEIAYDRAAYTGILLLFPGKLVSLKGRNLRPVVEALLAGTCEHLQQIGEGEVAEPGAPVIEDITTAGPKPTTAKEGG